MPTRQAGLRTRRWNTRGLSLAELLAGAAILAVAIAAMLETIVWQMTLNEHARNLSWANNDATRVMEQLREQNSEGVCLGAPNVAAPAGFNDWDAWLADAQAGGGGRSIPGNERLVVTPLGMDPVRVTVAVCWRHRGRTIGECTWDGATLTANPAAGGDLLVTESPAMLSTSITCRR